MALTDSLVKGGNQSEGVGSALRIINPTLYPVAVLGQQIRVAERACALFGIELPNRKTA
ncbi:hypothetical protein ACFRJ1_07425 [Streptomyces sp. NPDC056773]|uniref:hypothetical protein n=1 Tax=unclassified Streptomyces TaxID=2593676 RepID=UPI003694266A